MFLCRIALVAGLFVTLGVEHAYAEDNRMYPTANMLEVGLYSGAFIPSKNHELYDSTQSFQSPLNPFGLTFSLRAAYFPLSWLGAEVEGGFMPQQTEAGDTVNMFSARAHGVIQLPWRITPFAVAGGGYLGARSDLGGDVDRALHWGVGLKVYATSWMSLRVDGRQIWTAAQGPGFGNTSHFEALAGISFTLWRQDEDAYNPPPVIFVEKAPEPEPVVKPEITEVTQAVVEQTPAEQIAEELGRVHFKWSSATLNGSSFGALDLAADLLSRHKHLHVQIAGHADATGSERYNLKLSKRRAHAVRNYLIAAGVLGARLEVRAFGEWNPAAPNDTKKGRALNRRCVIRVVDRDGDEVASREQ